MEIDPDDAESQFQLATALGYVDRSEESDEHYKIALDLRSDTPAPDPNEQARLLALELMQEVEEAKSFFSEVSTSRKAALADLPKLPGVMWTRLEVFDSSRCDLDLSRNASYSYRRGSSLYSTSLLARKCCCHQTRVQRCIQAE